MFKMTYKSTLPKISYQYALGIALSVIALFSSAAEKPDSSDIENFLRPAAIPQPSDNKLTPERIELGKMLFFDPRLSGSNWISCATCHNPALGWSDGLKTAIGHNMHTLARSTPTIVNTAYQNRQFWDGRAETLEAQALGPIASPGEMAQNLDELVNKLKSIQGYAPLFKQAYPDEEITVSSIAKAISSFERSIVSNDSAFDRWLKGMNNAMSDSAIQGFEVFKGKGRCILCHNGFNLTDDGFHNIGLSENNDIGRYAIKPVKVLKGAFKTPTLRNIALTAPYMHNGEFSSLTEVIEHYNTGGKKNMDNLDPNMAPLGLSNIEKINLLEFLLALTDEQQNITVPVLPRKE